MNTSVKEAADILHVSEKTIYRWIKQEIIPVYLINDQYRFNRAELIDWAVSHRKSISFDALQEREDEGSPLPNLTESLEAGGVVYRLEGNDKKEVLKNLVNELRLPEEVDRGYLLKVLAAREDLCSTAVGNGVAIPHPRNPVLLHVTKPSITLAFLEEPIDFHALDGKPVSTLFCLISPTVRAHLNLLSKLSYALQDDSFRNTLENQGSRKEIFSDLKAIREKWPR